MTTGMGIFWAGLFIAIALLLGFVFIAAVLQGAIKAGAEKREARLKGLAEITRTAARRTQN